ncbi:MAG TPA: CHAT domain-containing protein, partial [Thermoanaerobaculia bacterium]|nr:CHAT domain-containing protein [Thermoanaerobaculia bacterium]
DRIASRAGLPTLRASTLAMLSHVDHLEGRDQLAAQRLEQAIELSRSTGQQFHLALALFGEARSLGRLGSIQAAEKAIAESLEITDELRASAQVSDWQSSFLATRYQAYELHVDLLMQLEARHPQKGYRERALQATDRYRARALLDQISDARRRQQAAELTPQALQSPGKTRARPAVPGATVRPAPPKLLQVEEIQQLLDPETSLLSFFLGEERGFVWLIDHDAVHTAVLPPRAAIERIAVRLQRLLKNPRLRSSRGEIAQLADILFGGIGDHLKAKRLLIVADGALRYLPFGVFPVSRAGRLATPLLEDHEITYLPSASVAGEIRRMQSGRPAAPRALAIFADPVYETDDDRLGGTRPPAASDFRRLPHTSVEADQIAHLIDEETLLLTGFAATREAAFNPELGRHRIVHFATHAQLEAEHSENSGIILSLVDQTGRPRNGLLRTSEIYDLRLPADLVVLSACETALGKEIKGEGIVGLSHAFFHAGAARLLVSLWRVDDEATAALMTSFYRGLLHEGLSAPEALRKAQLELRNGSRWRSPYFWAGFVLQGDWT